MALVWCSNPKCGKIHDTNLISFHTTVLDELKVRANVYHCDCGEHFREQLTTGISVPRIRSVNAEVQNPR